MASNTDGHYGKGDISIYSAETVKALFKMEPQALRDMTNGKTDLDEAPLLSEWIAWLLVRTALSNTIVFHSLHLLRRISARYAFSGSLSSPSPARFHHCLFLSALTLATKYSLDDCYDNSAFSVAGRSLFTVREVGEMELTMFRLLNWQIRLPYEDIEEIVKEMEVEWKDALEIEKLRKRELERVREREMEKPKRGKRSREPSRERGVEGAVRMVVKRTMSHDSTIFHGLRGVRLLTASN